MFEIPGQTKKCNRCGEVKSVAEFHRHKRTRDGLSTICKKCEQAKKQAKRDLPKEEVTEKRCTKCREVKPRAEFNKDNSTRDGLTHRCRACIKISRQELIKRDPALPQSKVCSQCGVEKPQQDFDKKAEGSDGLSYYCKQCRKLNYRMRYIMRALHQKKKGLRPGIETWEQAESLIREMAEIQVAVQNAKRICDNTINLAKTDYAQTIQPYITKQTLLQLTIEDYIRKICRSARRMVKKCRFGKVIFHRRKLDILLNVEYAKIMIGMP